MEWLIAMVDGCSKWFLVMYMDCVICITALTCNLVKSLVNIISVYTIQKKYVYIYIYNIRLWHLKYVFFRFLVFSPLPSLQRLRDLPFFIRRLIRELLDPQRSLPHVLRVRMIIAVKFLWLVDNGFFFFFWLNWGLSLTHPCPFHLSYSLGMSTIQHCLFYALLWIHIMSIYFSSW